MYQNTQLRTTEMALSQNDRSDAGVYLTMRIWSVELLFEVGEHCSGKRISTLPYINKFLYLDLRCIEYVSFWNTTHTEYTEYTGNFS